MTSPLKNEPVVTAVVTLLAAAGGLLAAFGVHLTDVQVAAVAQFVQDALIVAFLVRSQVTPKAHALRKVGVDATGQPIYSQPLPQ